MIPSSLELNSDDFPFFGDLKRTSRSREKLEKSSFENRDNHHRPRPRESRRWWWWWWWLEKIRKTKIQKKNKDTKTQRQIHTYKYRKIPNTQSQKDQNAKSQMSCCHADFFFFTSDYLIVCNYSNTYWSRNFMSHIQLRCCKLPFFATVELEFLTVELDFLPLNLSF